MNEIKIGRRFDVSLEADFISLVVVLLQDYLKKKLIALQLALMR